MPADDLGLIPYIILATIILLLLTTFLLRAYAHISVPKHARFIVWLSWTLCFSIVYILPIDLRPHVGNKNGMLPFYFGLYWFCFFLTWILTPFQSAYVKSGGFSTKERLLDAIKLNILFYIIVGLVLVIAFAYLLLATGLGPSDLGAVLQAFGNLWGLSFVIMTMGYGLIEIPRYFWYRSNYNKRLQYLYFKLSQLQENKENARDRVDELLYLHRKSKKNFGSEFVYEYAKIEEIVPENELIKIATNNKISQHLDITFEDLDNTLDCGDFKRKHLRKLHMLFKIWLFQLERTNAMFQKTIADIFYVQSVTHVHEESANDSQSEIIINEPQRNDQLDNLSFCNQIYYKFQVRGLPLLSKFVAILLALLTIMIIWSELMITFDYFGVKPFLSIFAVINASLATDMSIIFGVVLFFYLSSCSLFALWRIHINKDYHMHPFQLTDSGSILTNCAFCMRFMFPLGYNFLLMNINKDERDLHKENYPYLYLFHDMSVLPVIGDPVNIFLPMLVIVFCIATWFNVYGKLMKKLRISRFEFGDPKSAANEEIRQWINEGKSITKKWKKELNNDTDKKNNFTKYILDRFSNKSVIAIIFNKSDLDVANENDLASVSLVGRDHNIQDNIIQRNNKHKFMELPSSSTDL